MKVRTGFVSNSSSSSFIVVFPKHVGSVENMGELLFRGDWEPGATMSYYGDPVLLFDIAERVYSDYCNEKKNSEEARNHALLQQCTAHHYVYVFNERDLFEIISKGEASPKQIELLRDSLEIDKERLKLGEFDKRTKKFKVWCARSDKYYQDMETEAERLGREDMEKLLKTHKEYIILTLEYSDNDGNLNSILEHADIFKNLINKRISHH